MAGNENSGQRKDKLIRDALMIAAHRVETKDPEGRRKLAVAAAKVVEMAVEGDLAAFREMADRIDGKAIQSHEVDNTTRVYVIEAKAERPTAQAWEQQHKPTSPAKTIQ